MNNDHSIPMINHSSNEKGAPATTGTPLGRATFIMDNAILNHQPTQHNGPAIAPGSMPEAPVTNAPSDNFYNDKGDKIRDNGFRIVSIAPAEKYPAHCVLTSDENGLSRHWEGLRRWGDIDSLDPGFAKDWGPSSVGIVTGNVAAVDIDITDPTAARIAQGVVTEILGATPLIRQGEAPKIIMVYKTAKPFGKLSCGKVEVLCDGQMFVAFGIHPKTGKPYQWIDGEDPTTVDVDSLPEVSEEQVRAMMAALLKKRFLVDRGFVSVPKFEPKLQGPASNLDATRLIGSEKAIRSALRAIPNDFCSWNEWKRVGMLIYVASNGAKWGSQLWEEWSDKNKTITDPNYTADRAWQEMIISPPRRTGGANSLYTKARMDHGWTGEWEFPNAPNVDHVADDMMARLAAKAAAEPQATPANELPRAVAALQEPIQQPQEVLVEANLAAATILVGVDLAGPATDQEGLRDFSHSPSGSKASGKILTLAEARKRAENSPLAQATQKEDRKIRALVTPYAEELTQLWERLSGPNSRYTVLNRARQAMPSNIPPPLSTAAGLHFLSALLSSCTYVDVGMDKLHPVLWITITAISGAGKDKPIAFTTTALSSVGLGEMVAKNLTSDAAVETHLIGCNTMVYAHDEAGAKAVNAQGSSSGVHLGSVVNAIMELYTKTNDGFQTKTYSRGAGGAGLVYAITRPCLPVMMASTPTLMMAHISGGLLSGQGNRMLFIPCMTESSVHADKWPDFSALRRALTLQVIDGIFGGPQPPATGVLASGQMDPIQRYQATCLRKGVPLAGEDTQCEGHLVQINTTEVMREVDQELYTWQSLARGPMPNVLYNRFRENVYRVATLLQRARTLLSDPGNCTMDRQDVEDAMSLVKLSCDMVNTATIEFEREDEIWQIGSDMVATLRNNHGGSMALSDFKKLKRKSAEKQLRAIKMLETMNEIVIRDGRVWIGGTEPTAAAA